MSFHNLKILTPQKIALFSVRLQIYLGRLEISFEGLVHFECWLLSLLILGLVLSLEISLKPLYFVVSLIYWVISRIEASSGC